MRGALHPPPAHRRSRFYFKLLVGLWGWRTAPQHESWLRLVPLGTILGSSATKLAVAPGMPAQRRYDGILRFLESRTERELSSLQKSSRASPGADGEL